MLISTLPHLGERAFDPMGLVYAQATMGSIGGGNMQKMVQSLVSQATQLGANAIIDLKTELAGGGWCVMTGTAVRVR